MTVDRLMERNVTPPVTRHSRMRRSSTAALGIVACAVGVLIGLLVGHEVAADWFEAVGVWIGALGTVAAIIWAVRSVGMQQRADHQARLTERSDQAAQKLAVALNEAWKQVSGWSPRKRLDIGDWLSTASLYAPDLIDTEVFVRVNQFSDALLDFDAWTCSGTITASGSVLPEKVAERTAWIERLLPMVKWLGHTLAAHKNDQPLPPPYTSPAESSSESSARPG